MFWSLLCEARSCCTAAGTRTAISCDWKHPDFIHPGDHTTAGSWHLTALGLSAERFLFLRFSSSSTGQSSSFSGRIRHILMISPHQMPRCRTHKCVMWNGLYWGQNNGYCWMCECNRKVFVLPLDTCSFDAKTKSSWTSTWPLLSLIVLQTTFLELKNALWCLSYYFENQPLSPTVICTGCRSRIAWTSASTTFQSGVKKITRFYKLLALEGWFWAPEARERQPGSCSGPSPRPGAYAADLRGDESRDLPPPRRLPLPVTHRCWGKVCGGW